MNQDKMGKKAYGKRGYIHDYKKARNENADKRTEGTVKRTRTLWPLLVLFVLARIWGGLLFGNENAADKPLDVTLKNTSQVEKLLADRKIATDKLLAVAGSADVQEITRLIHEGAKVDAANNDGWTPLMLAARYNSNPEILRLLIKYGADVYAENNDGWTPLIAAAWNKSVPENLVALIENGVYINAVNRYGTTSLMIVARHSESLDVLQALIDKGANVNAASNDGRTPLMRAARYNSNPEIVRFLLENGADVGAKDKNGLTALDHAARNEKLRGTEAYNLLREKTHSPSPDAPH